VGVGIIESTIDYMRDSYPDVQGMRYPNGDIYWLDTSKLFKFTFNEGDN
jgi:hypothetical protein